MSEPEGGWAWDNFRFLFDVYKFNNFKNGCRGWEELMLRFNNVLQLIVASKEQNPHIFDLLAGLQCEARSIWVSSNHRCGHCIQNRCPQYIYINLEVMVRPLLRFKNPTQIAQPIARTALIFYPHFDSRLNSPHWTRDSVPHIESVSVIIIACVSISIYPPLHYSPLGSTLPPGAGSLSGVAATVACERCYACTSLYDSS